MFIHYQFYLPHTHLSKFHIYRIANYVAITGLVAGVGDQLVVPNTVIMPAVCTLTEDSYCRSMDSLCVCI